LWLSLSFLAKKINIFGLFFLSPLKNGLMDVEPTAPTSAQCVHPMRRLFVQNGKQTLSLCAFLYLKNKGTGGRHYYVRFPFHGIL